LSQAEFDKASKDYNVLMENEKNNLDIAFATYEALEKQLSSNI
jgi:hypothetical protein